MVIRIRSRAWNTWGTLCIATALGFLCASGGCDNGASAAASPARLADYVARAAEVQDDADAIQSIQREWLATIQSLRDSGTIAPGMSAEALEALLGAPTNRGDNWLEWYFGSSRIVNPSVIASLQGEVVGGVSVSAR